MFRDCLWQIGKLLLSVARRRGMSWKDNILSLVLQCHGPHDFSLLREKVESISITQPINVADILQDVLLRQQVGLYEDSATDSYLYNMESLEIESINFIIKLIMCQSIGYKAWFVNNIVSQGKYSNSLITMVHGIMASLQLLQEKVNNCEINRKCLLVEIQMAIVNVIDVVLLHASWRPSSKETEVLGRSLGKLLSVLLDDVIVAKLLEMIVSKFLPFSTLNGLCTHLEEIFAIQTNSFLGKLLLVEVMSLAFHSPEKFPMFQCSVSKVLSLWRNSLSPIQLESFEFRSGLLRWIENAPQIYLEMLLFNKDFDTCIYITERPELLLILLQSKDFKFYQLFLETSLQLLASTKMNKRLQFLRSLCNFIFYLSKKENKISLNEWFFTLIDEVIKTIIQFWIPSKQLQEGLDHLSIIFTTSKAENTSSSFLHTSFYFLDDFELILYTVGLIIHFQSQYNRSPSSELDNTFITRLIDNPTLFLSQELHINLSVLSLWEESMKSLKSTLSCSEGRTLQRRSITEHNVILLRAWSLISGIEKVTSVIMFSEESCKSNLYPFLQLLQSIKFFMAHSMQQLKYIHLFLGTGSLSSIMANKELGNSYSCIHDMIEDAVSRSIVESTTVNTVKGEDVSDIEEIHKNITVGINLPVSAAIHQWEYITKEVSTAMSAALPLISSIQITDIEPNTIKDDIWWEISLSSLCTSCYTFRESLDELYTRWDITGYIHETNNTCFSDLLSDVYHGYQNLVSQDKQDQLRKIYLKVKHIREAGCGDSSASKKVTKSSQFLQSTIIQHILKEPSSATDQMKETISSSSFPLDEVDDDEGSNKHHRLRRMLSMSTSKKQFASSIVAKKLAEKLVPHPLQSFLQSFLHRSIVAMRPTMVSSDETMTPFHQPAGKLLSLEIQDMLWTLRSEWLELLQICIKLASKEILSSLNKQKTCDSLLENVNFPPSWISLMRNMLDVFSAELVYSATAGVKKTVFENTVEVLYVLACALYPVEHELPLHLVIDRRNRPHSLSTRDLSRMLVVLQEVGASADQKLQRALMNLILQLSGSVGIMWKVAIPFILESCLHSWHVIDNKGSENISLSSDDASESECYDSTISNDDNNDDSVIDPIVRRRKKIETQIEMLDVFLQQKVMLIHDDQGNDDNDMAKALLLTLPQLEASSCYLQFDLSVAESLWIEIFRRFQFDLKTSAQSVVTLDNKISLVGEQDADGLCDVFVASEHLKILSEAFLHVSSTLLSSGSGSNSKDVHTFVLECLPWKWVSVYLSLVIYFISLLSQDVKRILKQIAEPINQEANQFDDELSSFHSLRFVPLSYALSLDLLINSTDIIDNGQAYIQSPNETKVSRIPLLSQFIALEDEVHSIVILLLIKHFSVRQQYLLEEKLSNVNKQLDSDFADEGITKRTAHSRTPPASVARLLGLKTHQPTSASTSTSPSKQQINNLKKRQSQLNTEQRKYEEVISKFSSLEEEFAAALKKYDLLGISPIDDQELFFCIGAVSEMLDMLTKDSLLSLSPNRKKRKRPSRESLAGNDDRDNEKATDDVERRQKLVRKSLQQRTKSNMTEKKSRVTSRNKVVNAWLGETEGNDAYADLEDFLV